MIEDSKHSFPCRTRSVSIGAPQSNNVLDLTRKGLPQLCVLRDKAYKYQGKGRIVVRTTVSCSQSCGILRKVTRPKFAARAGGQIIAVANSYSSVVGQMGWVSTVA